MKVIFIRHGQSEANVKREISVDRKRIVHITELGRKQALEAGKKLKRKGIKVILCSPFTRTKETAELINESLGKEIIIEEDLKEMDTGFDGKNVDEYHKVQEKSGKGKFEFKIKGKESFEDVAFRIERFLEELRKRDYKTVLCVTHEASLMVVGYVLGKKGREKVVAERFKNCEIVEIKI